MKKGLLVLFGLIASCSTPRDYQTITEQVSEYGVYRIADPKVGVVCYVYRDADTSSLSCVDKGTFSHNKKKTK